MRLLRYAVWFWLVVLLVLNVAPLGNDMSKSLSGNEIWGFRFDYLLHTVMILGFAWIEILKRVIGLEGLGVMKFAGLTIGTAVCMELLQHLIPWRSFNPVDMMYNLVGAVLGVMVIAISATRNRTQMTE